MNPPPKLKRNRRYPVVSVSLSAAEATCVRSHIQFDLHGQGLPAVASLEARSASKLAIWSRTGTAGGDAGDDSRMYLYLVTARGGGNVASALCAALESVWGDACRVEGSLSPVGTETALWERTGSETRRCNSEDNHEEDVSPDTPED
jgi:hypothetical protein